MYNPSNACINFPNAARKRISAGAPELSGSNEPPSLMISAWECQSTMFEQINERRIACFEWGSAEETKASNPAGFICPHPFAFFTFLLRLRPANFSCSR